MVAGDTKRIIVIKNISSNLIEEAILILKNEPDQAALSRQDKPLQGKANVKNDFILKEAEGIINKYINENRLTVGKNSRYADKKRGSYFKLSVNTAINIFLIAAVAFLIFVVSRVFL